MKSILEQLYAGEIIPLEQYRPLLQEYRDNYREKEETFESKLDDSLKKEFEVLFDEYSTSFPVEMAQEFMNGFKLGARIMCEVFSDQGSKLFDDFEISVRSEK